jgi:hypothetical protein
LCGIGLLVLQQKKFSVSGPMLQQKAKEVAGKLRKKLYLTTGKNEQLFQ